MRRVMIIGGPGAGKSTLARNLGAQTGLPVCHLDLIHWKPGWQERPMAQKLPMITDWEARDAWIIEGGLSLTYRNRAWRADTIVFLDLPLGLRLWRLLRRRLEYRHVARPDLPEDCPETLNWPFLHYTVTSARRSRARNLGLPDKAPHATFFHLRGAAQAHRWLASVVERRATA